MQSYQLSKAAKADLQKITKYTNKTHGKRQALKYINELEKCTIELANDHAHYKKMSEVHQNLAYKKCQKHYIFGIIRENSSMLIIGVFHKEMEVMNYLKKRL